MLHILSSFGTIVPISLDGPKGYSPKLLFKSVCSFLDLPNLTHCSFDNQNMLAELHHRQNLQSILCNMIYLIVLIIIIVKNAQKRPFQSSHSNFLHEMGKLLPFHQGKFISPKSESALLSIFISGGIVI